MSGHISHLKLQKAMSAYICLPCGVYMCGVIQLYTVYSLHSLYSFIYVYCWYYYHIHLFIYIIYVIVICCVSRVLCLARGSFITNPAPP